MPKSKDHIIPGIEVTIGGQPYTAAPLNFAGLRAVLPLMAKVSSGKIEETHAFIEATLRNSLRRNYDGVDQIWLENTMEASEFEGCAKAAGEILAVSGIVKRPDGASGEAEAGRSV